MVDLPNVKIGGPLVRIGAINSRASAMLEQGKRLRDFEIWSMPVLPGAVSTYIDLASSRHWAVSGPPRQVSRAVDFLNNATTYDPYTGQYYYGFTQFEQRRALDYLAVGRVALLKPQKPKDPLEYIDPTLLRYTRLKSDLFAVKPKEIVWDYVDGRKFTADQIILVHPMPIGTSNFVAPVHGIMPHARLAYLIREHDTAKLDGRKMRDILFVGNAELSSSIETALRKQAALAQGYDFSEIGVPVVEINNPSGTDIARQIHRLGLSEIPENFDRDGFMNEYVNIISGSLGIALRQFWNNERTTNRALEEVQEARQQQKGPAMFVRSEQRLFNNCGLFSHISNRNNLRFTYTEEGDIAGQLTQARVLYNVALALEKIQKVFGASINLEAYLAWMQSLSLLPNDIELVSSQGSVAERAVVNEEGDATSYNPAGEQTVDGDTVSPPLKTAEYGDITMDSEGNIVDRRIKTFPVASLFVPEHVASAPTPPPLDADTMFAKMVADVTKEYNLQVAKNYVTDNDELLNIFERVKKDQPLTSSEQLLIDNIYYKHYAGGADV